jgi:hypothetical protein
MSVLAWFRLSRSLDGEAFREAAASTILASLFRYPGPVRLALSNPEALASRTAEHWDRVLRGCFEDGRGVEESRMAVVREWVGRGLTGADIAYSCSCVCSGVLPVILRTQWEGRFCVGRVGIGQRIGNEDAAAVRLRQDTALIAEAMETQKQIGPAPGGNR